VDDPAVTPAEAAGDEAWPAQRRRILLDALAVAGATGAYGLSFGALATSAGLSVAQACALSLLMFTGASQFAFVGLVGGGPAAVVTAVLLGTRNAFYGVSLTDLDAGRGSGEGRWRRLLTAHFVIDETTAMALGQPSPRHSRFAFWATAVSLFTCWNLATLIGAVGARSLADPRVLGFDAAVPAAFLALLAPRLRGAEPWAVALAAAAVAVTLTPFVPAGVPVLAAAGVALVAGLLTTEPAKDVDR
jgi:predicted branched-subunit amino acid permease